MTKMIKMDMMLLTVVVDGECEKYDDQFFTIKMIAILLILLVIVENVENYVFFTRFGIVATSSLAAVELLWLDQNVFFELKT